MINKICQNKERLLLINLYFQYRIASDRFETNSNIPNCLLLIHVKAKNRFDFLENVPKAITRIFSHGLYTSNCMVYF
jgi:hypothetical protein